MHENRTKVGNCRYLRTLPPHHLGLVCVGRAKIGAVGAVGRARQVSGTRCGPSRTWRQRDIIYHRSMLSLYTSTIAFEKVFVTLLSHANCCNRCMWWDVLQWRAIFHVCSTVPPRGGCTATVNCPAASSKLTIIPDTAFTVSLLRYRIKVVWLDDYLGTLFYSIEVRLFLGVLCMYVCMPCLLIFDHHSNRNHVDLTTSTWLWVCVCGGCIDKMKWDRPVFY